MRTVSMCTPAYFGYFGVRQYQHRSSGRSDRGPVRMFHSLPCTKQCCAANEVTFLSPRRQPETLTWYSVTPDRKYWSAVTADGSPETWSNSSPFTRRGSATYQPSSLRSYRASTTSIV